MDVSVHGGAAGRGTSTFSLSREAFIVSLLASVM